MEFPGNRMPERTVWNSMIWYWNSVFHSGSANEPLLKFVEMLSTDAARLHEKFEKTLSYYGWQIYAVNETHAASEGKVLVPEGSSRSSGTNIFVGSDHYSICRPASQKCIKYLQLCKLIDPFSGKIKSREQGFQDFSSRLVLEGDLLERAKRHLQEHAFLGFAGMAGSGKTAMATLVAKSLERDCLSESGVLGGEFTPVPPNRAEFEKEVKAKLSGRCQKLFLILDDIPDLSHTYADKLQQIAVANGQRVKFIATSRDKGVLRKLGWINLRETWNVPVLEVEAAKKLFYSHAFPVEREPPSHLKQTCGRSGTGLCRFTPLFGSCW
ncbi:hypothetical protein R1sor_015524 [Riccia sorocarpa]|uniref:AAA+ ATPase domain-containing protein n=1 Tax=Riccia sorocarpa TaxID=122646 RepID=A0ABD3HFT3_9MARC